MAQNEVEYKVRIARNMQGKNGEAIRIKFGDAVLHRTGIPMYDRCFVGIMDNKIFFKFFNGLPNVISKFDDSKMFRIQSFGNMPGITITSKRFLEYFSGFEGEYDTIGWLLSELHVFYIESSNRRNFTNLYKNTSTTVTQKEEEPISMQDVCVAKDIATNSINGITQAKPADSMTPEQIERLREWRDKNTQEKPSYVGKKELTLGEGLNAMFDIMALRKAYTSLYLKVYYKALEKRDSVNVKYFSEKILGCMEFDDYKLFVHDVELALQSVIGFGERDYAELILGSIPELYELTRDYN